MYEQSAVIIAPEDPGTGTIEVPVLKVFDGDGFLTRIKTCKLTGDPSDEAEFEATVRFGFIDAPELGQPGGHEAKDFLTALIGDQWVELVILVKMGTGGFVDRHGRIVCVPILRQVVEVDCERVRERHNLPALEKVEDEWSWRADELAKTIASKPATTMVGIAVKLAIWKRESEVADTIADADWEHMTGLGALQDAVRESGLPADFGAGQLPRALS